jgi:hypothetical protein
MLVAAASVFLGGAPAFAGTFPVTNTNDAGSGSLRQAITDLNASPDSTNTIPISATGQINLQGALPGIGKPVQIQGPGSGSLDVHRQNGGNYGIFFLGATAGISGLTISNGATDGGAGVVNTGTLTLTDVVVSGNTTTPLFTGGGGIANRGTLTLTNSVVKDNTGGFGGGLWNYGTLTVTNSSVTNNTAAIGGGIFNNGILTVTNSTVSGNTATDRAGGIFSGGWNGGGGVIATIDSSTISGNHADANGGGGIQNDGTGASSIIAPLLAVTNSTIANNTAAGYGGGIDTFDNDMNPTNRPATTLVSSTVTGNSAGQYGGGLQLYQGFYDIRNSLIAQNTASAGSPDCANPGTDSYHSQGYNLIGNTSGCRGFPGTGDVLDANSMVGTLGANGGSTQTIPLLSRSPALYAGNPATPGSGGFACPATDQRGLPRGGSAGRCDIGAVQPGPPAVTISAPANGATFTQGQTVNAAYACTSDPSTTISSCAGPVASGARIDTSTPGAHAVAVTATDTLGATATSTNTYSVVASGPTITGASFAHKSFRAAKGTRLKLTLSENTSISVIVTRKVKGHRVRGKCQLKATTGKPCNKTVQLASLNYTGKTGPNVFTFRPRKLKPGTYNATITAIDATGNKSVRITLRFAIK